MKSIICLATLLGLAPVGLAQTASAVSEKDYLQDMPIVMSVSRLPQRLDETPGAVTILDRDMIRSSGARDVADLLRLVPGFQSSMSFETAAPLASYHGGFDSYSNRMQVLVDGRSVYSSYFIGSVGPGLQSVAIGDIERIEVMRGSNSAAYGARAILGVVNIVTRDLNDTLGTQISVGAGENAIRDAQARFGWKSDAGQFRLSVDRRADAGLSATNGHNQVERLNFRGNVRMSSASELDFQAGVLGIDFGKGSFIDSLNPTRDGFYGSSYAHLDWRRNLNTDEDLLISISHSEENYRDSTPVSLASFGIPQSMLVDFGAGKASNDAISAQHTMRKNAEVRVVWGGEFRHEQVASRALYNTEAPFYSDFTRLFGNVEWQMVPGWLLNAGAMLESGSESGDSFSPRLMINWNVAKGQTLRAGVSKSHRPPSTFEKYADVRFVIPGVGTLYQIEAKGNTSAEKLTSHELGYLGDFSNLGLTLDVRVFHEQITGFIRQQNGTRPFDYANDENFPIHGLEYQLKWRPWRDAQITFNQSYTKIDTAHIGGSVLAAPELASTLMFSQKFSNGLDFSVMHQDSSAVVPQNAGWFDQMAFTRTDLRFGMPLRWGVQKGEVALVVQNTGSAYQDFDKQVGFQRRAFVTLRLDN
jgi:iron complex outermembrane receptor protein